jgi:hypothetical protein
MRTVLEGRLTDVSIVARPAYPATESAVRKVLAEDGFDAECIAELLVRLRMGLPLDDENTQLLRQLATTFNGFMSEQTTAPETAPGLAAHSVEGLPPVMPISAPSEPAHPLSWYREQLDRMGA